jgi:hypothetical protein
VERSAARELWRRSIDQHMGLCDGEERWRSSAVEEGRRCSSCDDGAAAARGLRWIRAWKQGVAAHDEEERRRGNCQWNGEKIT